MFQSITQQPTSQPACRVAYAFLLDPCWGYYPGKAHRAMLLAKAHQLSWLLVAIPV